MRTCAGCGTELDADRTVLCATCQMAVSAEKDTKQTESAPDAVAATTTLIQTPQSPVEAKLCRDLVQLTCDLLRTGADEYDEGLSDTGKRCILELQNTLGGSLTGICTTCPKLGPLGTFCNRCDRWYVPDPKLLPQPTRKKIVPSSVDYKDASMVAKHLDAYAALQRELGVTVRGWCIDCIKEVPLPEVGSKCSCGQTFMVLIS